MKRGSTRLIWMSAALVVVLGCGDSKKKDEPETIPLTHTWAVSDDTAFFVANDMGTRPAAHADPLMAVVPGMLHRIGTKCAKAAESEGSTTMLIRFNVDPEQGQGPKALEIGPFGPLSMCVSEALEAETAAFQNLDLPKTEVLLRAKTTN